MLHIAFYYITVNRRRRSPSINRDYMDKGIFAAAASEPEASEQGSRPTIFARNYGTAAVITRWGTCALASIGFGSLFLRLIATK
jgi:hypothetical protein